MKKSLFSIIHTACLAGLLVASSCVKNDHGPFDEGNDPSISNNLHIAFKTPDWQRHINCDALDLFPRPVRTYYPDKGMWDGDVLKPGIAWVGASSASTRAAFMLSYPEKASELDDPGNLGRYTVAEYGIITEPFQFALNLPVDERLGMSHQWLSSRAGSTETAFTEITEIKRVGSEEAFAVFTIKGRYAFKSNLTTYSPEGAKLKETEVDKPVTGTFNLKVRAYID